MVKRSLLTLLILCSIMILIAACGASPSSAFPSQRPVSIAPTHGAISASPSVQPPPIDVSSSQVPFKVTRIDLSVSPKSIAELACGSPVTVVYTATFHAVPNSAGGTLQFLYTWNNGRVSPSASVTFHPGETTKTFSFSWLGNLPVDHTYPGFGEVVATSSNASGVTSPQVKPVGTCVSGQPFKLTSVDLSVTPSSIDAMQCGSSVTFVYRATFHAVPNSVGGTTQFIYTWNSGHASPTAKITFGPGETIKTFTFQVSIPLTYLGVAQVLTTSPDAVDSPQVHPTGRCG
jgi:hypothetical protein